jgi:hypothetical protein
MNYYRVLVTLSTKIRGVANYTKGYHFRGPYFEGWWWDDPKLVYHIRERIDFEPTVVDIELFAKSKILDLIENGGPASGKLLISSKLRSIIENYRKSGIQYFQFNVIKNKVIYSDYWILHMYDFNEEFIDFPNSVFLYQKKDDDFANSYLTEDIKMRFKSKEDFEAHKERTKENFEVTTIIKLKLKDNITEDFFALRSVEGGIGYFVSETLKNEIENAGCTGIEFQPSELSYNEWVVKGGPRDQVYGSSSQ